VLKGGFHIPDTEAARAIKGAKVEERILAKEEELSADKRWGF
jgi:hypothetical protein